MRVYLLIFYFVAVCLTHSVYGQSKFDTPDNNRVPIQYLSTENSFFRSRTPIDFNPYDLLPKYVDGNRYKWLDNLPIEEWPEDAKKNPQSVAYVQLYFSPSRYTFVLTDITIQIRDYKNALLYTKTKSIAGLSYRKASRRLNKRVKNAFIKLIHKSINTRDRLICKPSYSNFYRTPRVVKEKAVPTIPTSRINTGLDQDSIRNIIDMNGPNHIEGIYESIDTTGAIYTLGIIEADTCYQIICLASNFNLWRAGDLKATFPKNQEVQAITASWYSGYEKEMKPILNFKTTGILKVLFDEKNFKRVKTFRKTY